MDHAALFPIVRYWAHMQGMEEQVCLSALIFLGLFIGVLAAFFGIGGRFLMTPLLNVLFNIPYNVVVGSELCQMLGNASMNIMRIKAVENADYKLMLFLLAGSVVGLEGGVQLLELLKMANPFTLLEQPVRVMFLVFSLLYAGLLTWIGGTTYRELKTVYRKEIGAGPAAVNQIQITARVQRFCLPPMISLPVSGIESISLWVVLAVGFVIGLLVGFLGVGGSFIGLPALVYVLGCPMPVAVGTDIVASLFVMGYGAFSHSLKGNIDLALAVILLTCSIIGTQLGIPLARRFAGSTVRLAFAFAAYLVVLILVIKLGGLIGVIRLPYL